MTTQELIQEMMKHADELAIDSVELIPTGKFKPVKKHKKKRVQKKWAKVYGVKPVYVEKKCKKIDVTVDMLIEFCKKYNYPMPSDFTITFSSD